MPEDSDSCGEIEVTPEMVEAGRMRLFDYSPDFDNEDDVVSAIFREMLRVSRAKAVCRRA